MAKKTKDSNLSIEERLEQAVIPNWDEPYKLPDNWCWTKFSYCSNIRTGKKDANYGSENGEYPFFTCAAEPIRCNDFSFDCYALLLAGNGDIGNISIYNGKFEAYQRTYVVETDMNIDVRYAYYYFKYKWVDYNKDKMFGTAIPYIRLGNLQDFPFPIAPLHEQKRIVKYIDVLFAKLDEAKGKAQEVVDGFESRKAAILHKAFSGELTAKWRQKNKDCEYKWEIKKLGEIVSVVKDKYDPLSNQNANYPYIGLEHIQKGEGIKSFGVATDVKSIKGLFKKGDILYGKLRPYLDKHGIVDFDGVCSTDILIYRSTSSVVSSFVNYLFSTTDFINYSVAHSKGINLPRTSEKEMSNYRLHLPDEDEIEVLVDNLDTILKNEQQAKNFAESVIEQIDTMKKAILARAFRGELGTNDPSEESAVELLKQVLSTASEPTKPVRRTVIPKSLESRIKTDLERKIIKLYIQNEVNVLTIDLIMSVSSKKFDIMEALRNLQQRGILEKENDKYKLLG